MESTSNCESGLTNSSSSSSASSFDNHRRNRSIFSDGLVVELAKDEGAYELIRRKFNSGVGEIKVDVVAIHRRNWSKDSIGQARVTTFKVYAKALENKRGGGVSNNVKFGWYGSSKHRIQQILDHGFGYQDLVMNDDGLIFMSHVDYLAQSVEDSCTDEDGLRHVLLCRVLLGQSELVSPGSGQIHPSSDKFDSGVDSYDNPKNYVVWSTNMNTHILPEYVVTFKVKAPQSSSKGDVCRMKKARRMPTSPWISFPTLTSVLGKYLGPRAISLIIKYHMDYRERIISRPELIQKVRQIAGDKLLITVIKSFKCSKDYTMSFDLLHQRNYR